MCLSEESLSRATAAVLASAKYRALDRALVDRVVKRELAARGNLRETIKASRRKLHQIAGAYLDETPDYSRWLDELRAAVTDVRLMHSVCRQLMAQHSSTRERMGFIDEFYELLMGDIPAPSSVLDLACGLHPVGIPWMPLAPGARYWACDVLVNLVHFVAELLQILGVDGRAVVCDVTSELPSEPVDVAFVLKSMPCMERLERGAGRRLLHGLHADWVFVSYPLQSLGGRKKGMLGNYERQFEQLMTGEDAGVRRFEFPTELVFRLDCRSSRNP